MNEPTIVCPSCKTEIKLTESLAGPLVESTRQKYEQKIAEKEHEISKRETKLREQQEVIVNAEKALEQQISAKLKAEREKIVAEEAKKARQALLTDLEQKTQEITSLQEVLKIRETKLAEAQKAQAEIIRKQRELDDAKREMELIIEKRVQESLILVRDEAKKNAEETLKLKVLEKEQTITSMQRQIEELKRRAEQGSQQLQGEAQELELAIVEKFSDMHEDLERERKTMTRLWAKREEQIRCVIESTAGMYGDLQGIAGKTLLEIEGLNIKMIESNEQKEQID